jgi:glycosyltransferase involved in cell wall biosynthesis
MARHKKWVLHGLDPVPDEFFERLRAEWSVARRIIVNSAWSKSALTQQGVPAGKIKVCPLACKPSESPARPRFHERPRFRVLWLGRLSLGKGIVYAIEAARMLERHNVDFTFAGPIDVRLPALPANCTYIGRIPQSQVGTQYGSHDLFIFPTLSDGFGRTQLEAMAHGLPVIATPNCGEVVEHGISGLIVPLRDSRALAEAILEICGNRSKIEAMSAAAVRRSRDFTPDRVWQTFRACLV